MISYPKLRRVLIAIRAGGVTGILLGHIDILVRVAHLSFEWFEIYQALLVPMVIFALLFGLGAVFLELIRVFTRGKPPTELAYRYSLWLLSFVFPLATLCWIVLQLLVVGDLKSVRVVPDTAATLFLITLFVAAVFLVLMRRYVSEELYQKFHRRFEFLWSNYLTFCVIFSFSMLVYDAYQYTRVSAPAAKKPVVRVKTEKPNILLLTLDTLRADHLSVYGYQENTAPFLSELAAKSVVFTRAMSTAPWTLPAHASLFTGKYVHHHGAHLNNQQLDEREQTLAEVLQREGYRTGGFVAGPYCKAKYGLAQGFESYRDRMDFIEYRHTQDWASIVRLISFFSIDLRNTLLGTDGEVSAPEINTRALEWLDATHGQPFFLFLNYFDVHDPYNRGSEYLSNFTSERRDWKPIELLLLTLSEDPELRYQYQKVESGLKNYIEALYDAEIRYLDSHLQYLFETLEHKGVLDNTVVIIASDHGDEFFDHGGVLHMQTLYQEMIHIPLMVYYPEKFSPQRVNTVVSIADVFNSVLNILGLESERSAQDSLSFYPALVGEGSKVFRVGTISERYVRDEHYESQQTAVTGDKWKYIQVEPNRERIFTSLYDLDGDPEEKRNLLPQPRAAEVENAFQFLSKEVEKVREFQEKKKEIMKGP